MASTAIKGRSARRRKVVKGKGTRRGNDVVVTCIAAKEQYLESQFKRAELEQLAENPLPFQIVNQVAARPTWDDKEHPLEYFTRRKWDDDLCQIARAALRLGSRLLVPVPDDMIAYATCEIVRRLKMPVRVWYTRRHRALIVGLLEEHEI